MVTATIAELSFVNWISATVIIKYPMTLKQRVGNYKFVNVAPSGVCSIPPCVANHTNPLLSCNIFSTFTEARPLSNRSCVKEMNFFVSCINGKKDKEKQEHKPPFNMKIFDVTIAAIDMNSPAILELDAGSQEIYNARVSPDKRIMDMFFWQNTIKTNGPRKLKFIMMIASF